jgi:hypothetical protein
MTLLNVPLLKQVLTKNMHIFHPPVSLQQRSVLELLQLDRQMHHTGLTPEFEMAARPWEAFRPLSGEMGSPQNSSARSIRLELNDDADCVARAEEVLTFLRTAASILVIFKGLC